MILENCHPAGTFVSCRVVFYALTRTERRFYEKEVVCSCVIGDDDGSRRDVLRGKPEADGEYGGCSSVGCGD